MHHPLTRQRTLESVRSWWSDRNPVGPNINLHAAAKPLMRAMYRRDALALIRKNRGTPLSSEDMEIYSSYLAYKYVSSSTKAEILRELGNRADSTDDARAVIDSGVLHLIDESLGSPDPKVRRAMCYLIGELARNKATAEPILSMDPCLRLVSRLRDLNIEVIQSAIETLYWIAASPEGAEAAVEANVLDCIVQLLGSTDTTIRDWTTSTVGQLARHKSTVTAVLLVNPCLGLISLFHDGTLERVESAAGELYWIRKSPEGRQAVADANWERYLPGLLESSKFKVRGKVCRIVAELACDESTVLGTLAVKLCIKLALLRLSDNKADIIESAVDALHWMITRWPPGAQAAMDENVLDHMVDLVSSPNIEVQRLAYDMLGELAREEITAQEQLVTLMKSHNNQVVISAAKILSRITSSPKGAQAAVDANVLDSLVYRLELKPGSDHDIFCNILTSLASHKSTEEAVLSANLCPQLVSLLRNLKEEEVIQSATEALVLIAASPKGAQAALDAQVLDLVEEMLDLGPLADYAWIANRMSQTLGVLRILERLATHESIMAALLSLNVSTKLVSLFRLLGHSKLGYSAHAVPESAILALVKISEHPEGVAAIAATDFLAYASRLMEWPDHKVQLATCLILKNLAQQTQRWPVIC
ncbi:armadillo-type protein [Mycena latifolia]|nr:armadillo-type protein [Mycena latifolia]